MMSFIRKLASLRLTLVGMILLAVLAVVGSRDADIGTGVTVVPLVILIANLLAALLTNKSFRTQTGLLIDDSDLVIGFATVTTVGRPAAGLRLHRPHALTAL